jgi:hypothetical protein
MTGPQLIHANTTTDRTYRLTISATPAASTPGESLGVRRSHQPKARLAQGTSAHVSAATLSRLPMKVVPD